MQYCSAAPVTRYIPYTGSALSRCGSGRHRYCELYLGMAHPSHAALGCHDQHHDDATFPPQLYYAKNHLWLDLNDDGTFHIGIDALLAQVLGRVEKILYLPIHPHTRPSAILSVKGVDLQVVFPNIVDVTGTNTYLRANPERLTADPYGRGWLFEGGEPRQHDQHRATITEGLLQAEQARQWTSSDVQRLTSFLHEKSSQPDEAGMALMNDGGDPAPGVAELLTRDDVIQLFNELFSPYASLRK